MGNVGMGIGDVGMGDGDKGIENRKTGNRG